MIEARDGAQKRVCHERVAEVDALAADADHSDRVMLIEGLNMEATEAAGEFCLNPGQLTGILHALGAKHPQDLSTYELILETYGVGGAGRVQRIVDYVRP